MSSLGSLALGYAIGACETQPVLLRRSTLIAAGGAALIAGIVVVVLVLAKPFGASASDTSCSSFPHPGAAAPAGTKVPAALVARYALFSDPQRAADRLTVDQLGSLKASGLIMSGSRLAGDSASGGRIYLIPAEHLLSLPLAPARCLSRVDRVIEQESLSVLRGEYRQPALCVVVLGVPNRSQECVAVTRDPYPLLFSDGTPGFGLVPNGVNAVTVSYWAAPPRTVAVHRNFFVIVAPGQKAPPCGVQWLAPTGSVEKVATGCSYLLAERRELDRYRADVAGKLQALRSQVIGLSDAVRSGSLERARAAWLTAHVTWLEIGQDDGAYGAFGLLGGQIDGLAAGHRLGTSDPGFTGFHRIEFDLWTRHDLVAAAADTAILQRLLARLMRTSLSNWLPATANGIANWLLRPHEVLEDALRDSLTADDDYGSGTDLASIAADVAATRELLSELAPQVNLLAPGLIARASAELTALGHAIAITRQAGRGAVSIQDLPIRARQQIDADVDAALETLAPLPDLTTSTGSNAPTT
jgi:iron uptake system EfeUOB component EfeO/EfeM